MKQETKEKVLEIIKKFELPAYHEIPDVGLYLDQTVKYINSVYSMIPNIEITSSMVSNYVKKGIIDRPIKKCYSRDQICYLIFIVMGKSVLSMENIQFLFQEQKMTYTEMVAYEYLRAELRNALYFVSGINDKLEPIGITNTDTKALLRNTIMSVAYKSYLEITLEATKYEKSETPSND